MFASNIVSVVEGFEICGCHELPEFSDLLDDTRHAYAQACFMRIARPGVIGRFECDANAPFQYRSSKGANSVESASLPNTAEPAAEAAAGGQPVYGLILQGRSELDPDWDDVHRHADRRLCGAGHHVGPHRSAGNGHVR